MIHVNRLAFRYPGQTEPTIKEISFDIQPGEIFGFLGPSGAGKSTTQKILIGLLTDYSGEVKALGRDLKAWSSEYYEHVGVSFEMPNHYQKLTALENLRYFRSLYSGETNAPEDLLDMVGLSQDADTLVGHYSKGMKIRLNLARALLHNPRLIFLDEPTAGLDPVNAKSVKAIIRDLQREGRTFFLTTHNMADADELCDRVAFIVDGEIKRIDSPKQLKMQYGKKTVRVEHRLNGAAQTSEFPIDGLGTNAAFLSILRGQEIKTIHTQEATLEDIFIEVTGRNLA